MARAPLKKLGGHRYWKFQPDPVLTQFKHHDPKKLASMQHKLLEAAPKEGIELSHEERSRLHPALRERLPAGSRRADFEKVAESLEHARRLSEAGLHGVQFYPSVVDTSLFTRRGHTGDLYSMRTFLEVPGEEHRLIMPSVYVMPKGGDNYFIEAYGMQRAHERESFPRGLHRTYDVGAPALGLALTSALLRKAGANRIGLPGHELQWWRKGTKRPQSFRELSMFANSIHQAPETSRALRRILDNWNTMGGADVRQELLKIRTMTGQHFINAYGVPKVLLERNYLQLPERLGARPITAREALGPTASLHMASNWGVPEPEKLLGHRAYDMNIEKLDHLHPYLEPMTKKEVSDWKEKMKEGGHRDIDNITSII